MEVEGAEYTRADDKVEKPNCRIHFWTMTRPGWSPQLESFRAVGAADVQEVLAWIAAHRGDRPWELFAEVETPRPLDASIEITEIRLAGVSPVAGEPAPFNGSLTYERENDTN